MTLGRRDLKNHIPCDLNYADAVFGINSPFMVKFIACLLVSACTVRESACIVKESVTLESVKKISKISRDSLQEIC